MKLLLILGVLAGGYTYMLLQTTDTVMGQVQQLNSSYQYVAHNSENIAAGK